MGGTEPIREGGIRRSGVTNAAKALDDVGQHRPGHRAIREDRKRLTHFRNLPFYGHLDNAGGRYGVDVPVPGDLPDDRYPGLVGDDVERPGDDIIREL